MPKVAYTDKKVRNKERIAVIAEAIQIAEEYEEKGFDLTLRQIYYVFISRDLLPESWIDEKYNLKKGLDPSTKNTIKNYKRLGGVIDDGRMMGLIDWETIVDRTRSLKGRSSWTRPSDIIEGVYFSYHLSRWRTQDWWPEVWVEKEALAGVFARVCRQYDLPLFCCRGYGSQSAYWGAAQRLIQKRKEGFEPIILHFGDHDASGIDMTRDIRDRMRVFELKIEVRRLALNMDQVDAYTPPPNPAKQSDPRFKTYMDEYGEDSWELDALTPEVLNELVVTEVDDLRNVERWKSVVKKEQDQRARFKVLMDKWPEISKHLDDDHKRYLAGCLRSVRSQEDYYLELGEEPPEEEQDDDPEVLEDDDFEDCSGCGAPTTKAELSYVEQEEGERVCAACMGIPYGEEDDED